MDLDERAHPLVRMRDVWTFADLQSLDVEDWRRYEIVDGALVVSPTAGRWHAQLAAHIRRALESACGSEYVVLPGDLGISLGRSYRIRSAWARTRCPRVPTATPRSGRGARARRRG